jgi:hypothetical protein
MSEACKFCPPLACLDDQSCGDIYGVTLAAAWFFARANTPIRPMKL